VQNSYAMPEGLVRYHNALRIPDGKFIQTGPPLRRGETGKEKWFALSYFSMAFPIKTCVICSQEFELHPNKPGFANRCPSCSEPESAEPDENSPLDPDARKAESEMNEARRRTIRDMLYRKES
jgi:hypothetical protein